jgi:small-conductance mechanosensitive channel
MLKGIASLCLALILAPCAYAQNAAPKDNATPPKQTASPTKDAAPPKQAEAPPKSAEAPKQAEAPPKSVEAPKRADAQAQPAAAPPKDAAAPLATRAVMTGEQVIQILDETVDWYRMLGVQQQSSTQPSDLLILYANRQTADRVVALAFELARANAELLSSQAEVQPTPAADTSAHEQSLEDKRRQLDGRYALIQSEIAATKKQLEEAKAAERSELQAKIAELQSELELVDARRNLLGTMTDFEHESDANGTGVSALKDQINAIAASIPAAAPGAMPELGGTDIAAATASTPAAPAAQTTEAAAAASRFGIWDLTNNVLRLQNKLSTIGEIDRRTAALQKTFTDIRSLPEKQIKALAARGDALAQQASGTAADFKSSRAEYDTLAWLFSQTSSILVPLSKAGVLLEQYRNNLSSWRDSTTKQYHDALLTLATRLGMLLLILAAVFIAGELWKRAVFNYVQEVRRRHQLLLVRRIVVWAIAIAIVGVAFATEATSFATFAGLLTAGVAVAMQSPIVSLVGYFFLIGKYGLRVGDRVQIGTVTGDVIDLGLVRLHLMELGPQYRPTGRVVAFANSVVFQASGGIFKQIPGVSLGWREFTLTIPGDGDFAAIKQRLLDAAHRVLEDYREEFDRQTRALQRASTWREAQHPQADVQLRFSSGTIEAIVRYPVPLPRAAEVEERMSQALLDAGRGGHPPDGAALAAQTTH